MRAALKLLAKEKSMDELFAEARGMGLVRICTMSDGGYYTVIEFPTIASTKLEAKSNFNHQTPHESLQFAIDAAHEIKKAFK